MENHILEGTYPDVIPKFTPKDANPKYHITSVIASIDQGGLDLCKKVKPEASPPAVPARERVQKRQKLSPFLGRKISPRLVFSIAEMVSKEVICYLRICQRSIVLSFASTIKDAPSPIRLAILSTLEGGRSSLLEIRRKFSSTSMPGKERRPGLTPKLSRSIM